MKPVSLEPVGPEEVQKFSREVTNGQITGEKNFATNAFQWENCYIFAVHFERPTSSNVIFQEFIAYH
jgi:hypothetical protein